MITPLIHRVLTREDLARLVAEIGRVDQAEARAAEQAVQAGGMGLVRVATGAVEAGPGAGARPPPLPPDILREVALRPRLLHALRAVRLGTCRPGGSWCARAAGGAEAPRAALAEGRRDSLGRDSHSGERRLERFLSRLGPGSATPPTLN